MQVVRMKAERRTALGRNQVAQLRKQGWMPAVVYGDGKEPVSIAISEWELEQHVKAHHKVFQLEVAGAAQAAILLDIAWHATSDRPVHADFKRIDLTKEIETEVEVTLVGHPVGISKGGTLIKDHIRIEVRCLPTEIPDSIEYDVSKLELDESVAANKLVMPKGVTLLTPPNTTICHVAKLVVEALPEAAPAAAAVPAEGAAAATPAAGAAPAAGDKAATPAKPAAAPATKPPPAKS
ncbi:MAG TPA: 50S ribosomal protein L25 [Planctomycetota bacterium]|nr:50S ribosomal protein L25 [Planctomycetota bacterium]